MRRIYFSFSSFHDEQEQKNQEQLKQNISIGDDHSLVLSPFQYTEEI
jgi:hypothetical protein